jgi:hypothetical protein
MNQRSINLSPWEEISISTEIQHHTLIDIATIIIGNDDDYYFIEDDIEKVMDVSSMPNYIKEDWINYNKKDINQKVLDNHIAIYTDKIEKIEMQWPYSIPPADLAAYAFNNQEVQKVISILKSIKRNLIIKNII